jgi:hypothetical protein
VAPVVSGGRFELDLPGPLESTGQRRAGQAAGHAQL